MIAVSKATLNNIYRHESCLLLIREIVFISYDDLLMSDVRQPVL